MHTFKVKTLHDADDDQLVMTSVYTTCQESALRYAMALYPEIERRYWDIEQIPADVDAALIELIKILGLKKCSNWNVSNQVWENSNYFVYIGGWDIPYVAIEDVFCTRRMTIHTVEEANANDLKQFVHVND